MRYKNFRISQLPSIAASLTVLKLMGTKIVDKIYNKFYSDHHNYGKERGIVLVK